ncbi:MAG: phenylalanine--tRNA ligase subunit beta, partial [Acidimicrobiales bacterium]
IEPNRPDCLSILGVARDLAARYGLPLVVPDPQIAESDPPAADLASVEIDAPDLCQRLIGRVLTGVTPLQSPMLIQRRLLLAGMRPINHIVDASNYVMLELGQPNHPYDLDELGGGGLRVRAARPGETIVTLDGESRILGGRAGRAGDPLAALDALICNADDLPVGLAGVMGGRSSEISEKTASVLLEVANFAPSTISRTARQIGLRSEASVRFERGIDPEGLERAAARFCELVVSAALEAGAAAPVVASGIVAAQSRQFERARVQLRPQQANKLLGLSLEPARITALLTPIGYLATARWPHDSGASEQPVGPEEVVDLLVPSWRPDVTGEVDVIEDIARAYGYRRIPRTERRSPYVGRLDPVQALRRQLRRILIGMGAHEAWTNSLVDPAEQELAGGASADLIRLANPMVAEESVMRAVLQAGLLKALRHNAAHRNPWLRMFEIGDVFAMCSSASSSGGGAGGDRIPAEVERVALILALEGDDCMAAMNGWRVIADSLGITGVEVCQPALFGGSEGDFGRSEGAAQTLAGLHDARSGFLVVQSQPPCAAARSDVRTTEVPGEQGVVGVVGEIDPAVLAAFGVPHERVGWLEINLAQLLKAPRRGELAAQVSRYPSSDIDIALTVDEQVPASRVQQTILLAAGQLCESLELFDVYRGPGIAKGHRSLAFRLRLCAVDHTLTDSEVSATRQRCIEAVESALPAYLRA